MEKKVFTIEVGKLSKEEVEEIMRKLKRSYEKPKEDKNGGEVRNKSRTSTVPKR